MKSPWTSVIGGVAVLLAGLGVAVSLRDRPGGVGWFWGAAFGPADQGPVDFASLKRRGTPNDSLVCTPETCGAKPDLVPPLYTIPAAELRRRLTALILSDSDAEQVAAADGAHGDRFVVRTRWLRFPDTVDVLVLPRGDGVSTLALYSRSLVGRGDMGVNRRRLERWLASPAMTSAGQEPVLPPQG
jgi:uncharacterized protein (DUF1499 family)